MNHICNWRLQLIHFSQIINLSGVAEEEDIQIVSAYNEALAIYGDGEVLAILANREDDIKRHFINKRDAKDTEETRSTIQPPVSEENQEDFIYIADGMFRFS